MGLDFLLNTVQPVAVLCAVGLVGFWLARRRVLDSRVLGALSTINFDVALTCMVFSSIYTRFSPRQDPTWWHLPLWWAGFKVLAGVLTLLAERLARRDVRREFRLGLFFPNEIFFPLTIIVTLLGPGSPLQMKLFVFTLFYALLFYGLYPLVYGGGAGGRIAWKKVCNPIFFAGLLALALRLAGLDDVVPRFAGAMIGTVGDMSVPLFLLVIGGNIHLDRKKHERIERGEIVKFVICKNLGFPLVTLLLLHLIRPGADLSLLVFIQSCVPPLVAVPIVVELEGGNRAAANQFLLFSILASVVSIPLMLWLYRAVR